MKHQFRICDRCKATSVSRLIPKLKQLDAHAEIIVGCQNLCGIGRTKCFAIVNHTPIIASDEQELMEKIKQKLEDE